MQSLDTTSRLEIAKGFRGEDGGRVPVVASHKLDPRRGKDPDRAPKVYGDFGGLDGSGNSGALGIMGSFVPPLSGAGMNPTVFPPAPKPPYPIGVPGSRRSVPI